MRPIPLLLLLLSGLAGSSRAAEAVPTKPNILFLVADDLNWHSVGYAGDPVVQTPNLDRLARAGLIFTRAAVTTSICGVSRASLLTGRWLSQLGESRVTPETWPLTWPAQLRSAGYFGGHIGKLHVGGLKAAEYDFWAGRNGYAWLDDGKGGRIHSIQNDTDEALRFLHLCPTNQPFFLQVAYTVPHAEDPDPDQYLPMPQEMNLYVDDVIPIPPTATEAAWSNLPALFHSGNNESRNRWRKRFDTPEKYQAYVKNYYRLISGMDRSIGVILADLKARGLAENTVVVFTGDNGYFLGEHGLADKWYCYEESLRVPLFVYDPRPPANRAGQTCDDWVLNVDFAPTFCALAGIKPPALMQGRSILPLLQGRTPEDWRKDFLYQFKWSSEIIPASEGVCSKDFKYINWLATGTEELFNLRADPHETNNLSQNPEYAALLARLRSRRMELRAEVGGTPTEKIIRLPRSQPDPLKKPGQTGE